METWPLAGLATACCFDPAGAWFRVSNSAPDLQPTMNSADQPKTPDTGRQLSRAPMGELMQRVERSRAELALRQAVTQSIGDLAQALEQAGQREDGTSRVGKEHDPGEAATV